MDVTKLANAGWRYHTQLEDGIRLAYKDFLSKGELVAER
jgi:GDP-L-fucose synthase